MAGYAMRAVRGLVSRKYAVAWIFLVLYGVSAIVYTLLSPHAQAVLVGWSSTNVDNLRTDPIGSLAASAFIPGHPAIGWVGPIIVALFTANKLLGNAGTALLTGAGQVIGTLVSEGIVAARVADGSLPRSAQLIIDVGPSYVVVCALAATMLYATWLYATAAGLIFAGMVGDLFGGLSHLDVSAVGHLTALATGIVLGGLLLRRARRRLAPASEPVAGPAPEPVAGLMPEPVAGAVPEAAGQSAAIRLPR
jgi:hypothetical protein